VDAAISQFGFLQEGNVPASARELARVVKDGAPYSVAAHRAVHTAGPSPAGNRSGRMAGMALPALPEESFRRVLCVVAHPEDMEYGTSAAVRDLHAAPEFFAEAMQDSLGVARGRCRPPHHQLVPKHPRSG